MEAARLEGKLTSSEPPYFFSFALGSLSFCVASKCDMVLVVKLCKFVCTVRAEIRRT